MRIRLDQHQRERDFGIASCLERVTKQLELTTVRCQLRTEATNVAGRACLMRLSRKSRNRKCLVRKKISANDYTKQNWNENHTATEHPFGKSVATAKHIPSMSLQEKQTQMGVARARHPEPYASF
ncbi:hypothetical protein [Dyella flagellata]|uniref:hypothetical protein n=1 Tax=Dyella flagellata TaxID=1867833 RepID=UPI0024E18DBE|nr:hypothetical protein [Dyella flagellata]